MATSIARALNGNVSTTIANDQDRADSIPEDSRASRVAELKSAADRFLSAYSRWRESAAEFLDVEFEERIGELFETFSSGDLPAECRGLAAAVGGLQEQWESYLGYVSHVEPQPRGEFWGAIEEVLEERRGVEPVSPKRIESVRMLRDQKVPDNQIALMYATRDPQTQHLVGPFHRDGQVQYHLIQRESDSPGSVVPEDWIHPDEVAKVLAARRLQSKKISRLQPEKSPGQVKCRETIEELLNQKVTPRQIAMMHGTTVDEVIRHATLLGIKVDGYLPIGDRTDGLVDGADVAADAAPDGGLTEPNAEEEDGDGDGDDGSSAVQNQILAELNGDSGVDPPGVTAAIGTAEIDDEVAKLSAEGQTAMQIAGKLGLTVQKVAAIIRRRRQGAS